MDRLSCTYSLRTVRGAVDAPASDGLADRGRGHRVFVPGGRDLHRVRGLEVAPDFQPVDRRVGRSVWCQRAQPGRDVRGWHLLRVPPVGAEHRGDVIEQIPHQLRRLVLSVGRTGDGRMEIG